MSLTTKMKRYISGLVKGDETQTLPMNLLSWLFIIAACFIAGGGIYSLLHTQYTLLYINNVYYAFYPGELDIQTVFEAFASTILNVFSVIGMYLSYKSTQILYEKKKAQTYLLIGVILLLLGTFGHNYLLGIKKAPIS